MQLMLIFVVLLCEFQRVGLGSRYLAGSNIVEQYQRNLKRERDITAPLLGCLGFILPTDTFIRDLYHAGEGLVL